MNKTELRDAVAAAADLNGTQADKAVNAVLDSIASALAAGSIRMASTNGFAFAARAGTAAGGEVAWAATRPAAGHPRVAMPVISHAALARARSIISFAKSWCRVAVNGRRRRRGSGADAVVP